MFLRLTALVVLMWVTEVASQGTPLANATTGVIRGVVSEAETGRPLHRAEVRIDGGTIPRLQARKAVTDEQGRYEVQGLEPGRYTLTASKVGYLERSFGRTRPDEDPRPVEVSGSRVEKVDFALQRGGVIVVRITDEFGDPLAGVTVLPAEARFLGGRRQLEPTRSTVGPMLKVTDDRGEVRVFGLPPGTYYIAAQPDASAFRNEVQTFFPGVISEEEAQPITLGVGEETSVTLPLVRARRALRISGVVVSSRGGPVPNPTVALQLRQLSAVDGKPIQVAENGTFSAEDLTPGDYVLQIRGPEYASRRIRLIDQDVSNLVVATMIAAPIVGRIIFDAARPPDDLAPTSIAIRPTFLGSDAPIFGRLFIANDWTFESTNLLGMGVLRLTAPSDWFMKAVLLNGEDVTDTPLQLANAFAGKRLDIVLTQRGSEVNGTVLDGRGTLMDDCVVVLFPQDRGQWTPLTRFIATSRPDQHGRFAISGMPRGTYLLAAVDALAPGEEGNPEKLEQLRAGAVSLSLGDGESRTVTLKLSR